MSDLLTTVLNAHGGLHRWNQLRSFTGHMSGGGPVFDRVRQPGAIDDVEFAGECHEQKISQWPISEPGLRSTILPDQASLRNATGEIFAQRKNPRAAYPADSATGWDALNLAYFAGYAMWNYLTAPFIFTCPGLAVRELTPVQQGDEELRRLEVTYPREMMTHSRQETFYISDPGLIVRVDYEPDVMGGIPAANFASEHQEVEGGLIMPTRRTVYARKPDGTPNPDIAIWVKIDRLQYA